MHSLSTVNIAERLSDARGRACLSRYVFQLYPVWTSTADRRRVSRQGRTALLQIRERILSHDKSSERMVSCLQS